MKRLALFTVITMTLFLCISGLAIAQDATLTMSEGQFDVGSGFSWSKGTLDYQSKIYTFKVTGLSIADVGITKTTALGKVYNFRNLQNFNGNFTAIASERTLAGGAGVLRMKNQNGVEIELVTTTTGAYLKLAPEGVQLTLEK
jgi:hypothetical protein